MPDSLADRQLLAVPSRQSPFALIFIAWRSFRQFQTIGIGAVVLLFTGRLSGPLLAGTVALACLGLAVSVLAWWRYIFYVEGDELVVSKGVLSVERLSIPLNRVQSASIEQKFLHRPVGLVRVSIDTAGSSEAEFEIDAIPRSIAEALQRIVTVTGRSALRPNGGSSDLAVGDGEGIGSSAPSSTGSGIGTAGSERPVADEVVFRRSWQELVRIGLARWPWAGFVAFVPLVAVADDLLDFAEVDVNSDDLPLEVDASFQLFLAVGAAVLVVTVIGAALQVGRQLLSNWDLTLLRSGNGLRRTAGLFNKTSRASSLTRIQSLQMQQSILHRLFSIYNVQLSTIGDGDLPIPGSTPNEITRLRQLAFNSPLPPALDQSVSPIIILRETRAVALIVVGIFVAIVAVDVPWWGWFVAAAIPLQAAASYWKWKQRRWSYTPAKMAERHRFLNAESTELEPFKAQTVEVAQNIFEKRRGLATITVRMAEGQLSIPLIDESVARRIRDSILYQAETDPRAWM